MFVNVDFCFSKFTEFRFWVKNTLLIHVIVCRLICIFRFSKNLFFIYRGKLYFCLLAFSYIYFILLRVSSEISAESC